MPDPSRFDRDPEALAWARSKVQENVDRCSSFHRSAAMAGQPEQAEMWGRLAARMRRTLIGGNDGGALAAFDERLPDRIAKREMPGGD